MDHPFSKKVTAAFRAEAAIDRREFGVTWNPAMDTGGANLGERVLISLEISAITHWGYRPLVAAARDEVFAAPPYPANALVVAQGLAEPHFLVEIEGIAVLD